MGVAIPQYPLMDGHAVDFSRRFNPNDLEHAAIVP
jgi:hypothetical protein